MMPFSDMLNMPNYVSQDFASIDNLSSLSQPTGSGSTTFFDGSLLSPASISLGGRTTPSSSARVEGHEKGAYIQLWEQYQQREKELGKTKQELESLRYV
jgi:hypothetical protein